MNNDKNIQKIKNKISPTLRRFDVVKAAFFGSFARGENRKGSDIDILVEFKGKKTLLDLVGLELALERLLKRKVDVLTYRSIHPLLKDIILKEERVIL